MTLSPVHVMCVYQQQHGEVFVTFKKAGKWGAWVAQSVNHLTLALVMISQFMSSSPASGPVLIAQSLEPASDSVSPPLSAPSPLTLYISQKINIKKIRMVTLLCGVIVRLRDNVL